MEEWSARYSAGNRAGVDARRWGVPLLASDRSHPNWVRTRPSHGPPMHCCYPPPTPSPSPLYVCPPTHPPRVGGDGPVRHVAEPEVRQLGDEAAPVHTRRRQQHVARLQVA